MRTTLAERLTPEVTEAFNREKQMHPQTIEQIMYDLSNCLYWQDMSIKVMRMVYLFSDVDRYEADYLIYWWGDEKLFTKDNELI